MLRSFYIAGTGMLVQREKMDVLTNNITNIDTTGYKKDSLISSTFEDMLIERVNDPYVISTTTIVGLQNTGTHVEEIVTQFEQGSLEATGRSCDVALRGDGFFVVSTGDGDRYTRDGSFSVDENGYLVNSDGYYVMGKSGRIYAGSDDFTIDEQGNIYVDDVLKETLIIVAPADLSGLRKQGNNLYYNYAAGQMLDTADTKVMQGYLESSNVDMAEELVEMMALTRAYELNQRVLKMVDESLEITVNQVGKV
ncbi:MAG: flagellar basal-body rod protein FlgF [Eubacteriales bacterium]|nr:flagellar basal-body rod protein FlgF [Eubacteriales bacterium]